MPTTLSEAPRTCPSNGQRAGIEDLPHACRKTGMVGRSPAMLEIFERVQRCAPYDCTVLVTGESGTGKELVAKAIHDQSLRSAGPFITVNMAAVPEALAESELFGHVKGAFTGAGTDRIGCFEAARGGTIFIDEIGDLKLTSQAKLLRVLENRTVTPVGSNETRSVDIRVVAATNHHLQRMVAEETFRSELFYRLNVVHLELPPLRERRSDIPILVNHFLSEFQTAHSKPKIEADHELIAYLEAQDWPGNVRQLRNCMESMIVLARGTRLSVADVPPNVRPYRHPSQRPFKIPDAPLAEIERAAIAQALDRCQGKRTKAAHRLGISVRTLQRRLAQFQKGAE